jgi:hypothetical protein
MWAGITPFLLALALSALVLSRPVGGWEAATLIATAVLVALCAGRVAVVPMRSRTAGSVIRSAVRMPPVPTGLRPNAPGHPQQPRAPGRAAVARPC